MTASMLQVLFSGLMIGAVYGLVAIGFTLIYSSSGVINFAQGEFVMLGGMITATGVGAGMPIALAMVLAIVCTVLVGMALHLLAIEPARDADPVVLIIITIGASVFLKGLAGVFMGKAFQVFPPISSVTVNIGGAFVQAQAIALAVGAIIIVLLLWAFLWMSRLGRGVRATAANRLAAQLSGVNSTIIVGVAFAVSALIGAAGGILITPIAFMSYAAGTLLAIKGFAAAMLGGLTHPAGPIIGGLLIGLVEAFGASYISSEYKDVFVFIMLLGVLFIRPEGILGRPGIERV